MVQKSQHWFGSEVAYVIPNSATEAWCDFQPLSNLDIQTLLHRFYSLPHCEEVPHSVVHPNTGVLILQLAPLDATVK